MTLDTNGTITGGSGYESGGGTFTLPPGSGSFTIDANGVVTGSVASGLNFVAGRLDASENLLWLATTGGGGGTDVSIMMGIKASAEPLATSDLAGTWYLLEFADHPTPNSPYWSAANVTVNATGTITGGHFTNSMGGSGAIISGNLSVDAEGYIVGSGTATDGVNTGTMNFSYGKLDSTKNFLGLAVTESSTDVGIMIGIKGSGITGAPIIDFNADTKPDILLQNTTSGDIYVWYMDGVTITGGANVFLGANPVWQIVGPK